MGMELKFKVSDTIVEQQEWYELCGALVVLWGKLRDGVRDAVQY